MSRTVAVISRHSSTIIPKLQDILPTVNFIKVQKTDLSPLKDSEIVIADYPFIGPHLYNLPKLKWVHGTWAGIDSLLPFIKKEPPKFPITRTSGDNFGQLMGEYVIANMVFFERNYLKVWDSQKEGKWEPSVSPFNCRSTKDLTVGILGIGAIGNHIGKMLNHMGATIYGYGRRESINLQENNYLTKYYSRKNLEQLLASVDYLINILPSTEETKNLLGNGILNNCKNAVFINIGRGNIIKENELVEALKQKWVCGAVLDVFEHEPLPRESKLWTIPNVFVTPHIAGNSRAQDVARKFKENFEKFVKNEQLDNQIDFAKGY